MKVAIITAYTPTPENKGGISALLYHLLEKRPKGIEINLYTYNLNNISKTECRTISDNLRVKIEYIQQPKLYTFTQKHKFIKLLSLLLRKEPVQCIKKFPSELIRTIQEQKNDFVWVYPYFYYNIAKYLPNTKVIITGPDCCSQELTREMQDAFFREKSKRLIRVFKAYLGAIRIEHKLNMKNITMHFVGAADSAFYQRSQAAENGFFMLHPHYRTQEKKIMFQTKKISVLIAGKNDGYMATDAKAMINALEHENSTSECVTLHFLGKGWDKEIQRLTTAGYECEQIGWVEDYIKEIIKYDVQVTPISVGSGTKGKVLDALANGLLVVGSEYALENICVRDNDSCIRYKDANRIPRILRNIQANREKYERIAEKGRTQVRTYHAPERISKRFFDFCYRIASNYNK
jgi:hypothetical protein